MIIIMNVLKISISPFAFFLHFSLICFPLFPPHTFLLKSALFPHVLLLTAHGTGPINVFRGTFHSKDVSRIDSAENTHNECVPLAHFARWRQLPVAFYSPLGPPLFSLLFLRHLFKNSFFLLLIFLPCLFVVGRFFSFIAFVLVHFSSLVTFQLPYYFLLIPIRLFFSLLSFIFIDLIHLFTWPHIFLSLLILFRVFQSLFTKSSILLIYLITI